MESSAIRDLLDVIERPGVISLAGGVPAAGKRFRWRRSGRCWTRSSMTPVRCSIRRPRASVHCERGSRNERAWNSTAWSSCTDHNRVSTWWRGRCSIRATTSCSPTPVTSAPIQAFRLAGGHLVGVPSDRDGLCVDDLRSRLASGAPTFTRLRHRQLRQPDRSDALARTARRGRGPRGSLRVHDRRGRTPMASFDGRARRYRRSLPSRIGSCTSGPCRRSFAPGCASATWWRRSGSRTRSCSSSSPPTCTRRRWPSASCTDS